MQTSSVAWNVAQCLVYAFIVRCVLVYSYRVLLHPLASYPGPFVAKISDWYGAYHAVKQDGFHAIYRNHQRYGSVYRQGPNKLIFNSARAVQDIYRNERFFKSHAYLVTQPLPNVYNLFNVLDKRLHRVKRRIIGEGVSDKAMREFEPLMRAHVDTFVLELIKSSSNDRPVPIDMSDRCKYLGIDIIGQLGFGTELKLQKEKKNRFILKGMATSMYRTNLYIQFPLLKKAGMELLMYPFILTSQLQYYRLLKDLIVARKAEDIHARKDLYSFVANIKDPETGKGMRLRDIWSEAAFFMPAGGDTTATALTGLFFYLSRYPTAYTRLASEIRTTFPSGRSITNGPALHSCTYLRACIDETLRLTPPVCGTLWREYPRPDGDPAPLVVDGCVVPPGTEVGVNISAIHHNGAYFPDPFAWRPERWLDEDGGEGEEARKAMRDAFTPFSMGMRGCAGKAMAYMEMGLVLAKTLWYVDFERPVGEDRMGERMVQGRPVLEVKDLMSSVHQGPELVFRPRGEFWKELVAKEE